MSPTPTLSFESILTRDELIPVSKVELQRRIFELQRERARLVVENRALRGEIEKRDYALLATVGPVPAYSDGAECHSKPLAH